VCSFSELGHKVTGIEIEPVPRMAPDTASNRIRTAVLALFIVCVVPAAAWSQEQQGFAKVGGYVGGSFVPAFTLDGETFDGFTVYREIDGDEIAILPRLDKQKMFRGVVGHRYEKAALELSYERTSHNGVFAEVGTGEATFQQLNADARFFFLTRGRVQPYILAGGGLSRLSIKDGSFLLDEPDAGVGDARFKGYALNTEVGVTVYPHPQVGIVLGYGYRPIWFDGATGMTATQYELRPRFRESSRGVIFTTLVTF
jgi:opacity protein-like surface antigen